MSYRREGISLSQLIVNIENPRFEIVNNQREALLVMIKSQSGKLERLAADIVEYGLGPHESIIVTPHESIENHYSVLEGNRRVTALKLLDNPRLIPNEYKAMYSKFKKLSVEFLKQLTAPINCVVFPNGKDAFRWIKLIHTGENDGVGRVNWDAQQKSRYEERTSGKLSLALQVINFLHSQQDFELKSRLQDVPSSSLQRLVGDPAFREAVGIDVKNGELISDLDPVELVKPLKKTVIDLLRHDFSIKDIYYKEDRLNYINSFDSSYLPDKTNSLAGNWQLNSINIPAKPKAKNIVPATVKGNDRNSPIGRSSLIPKSFDVKINHPTVQKLFEELKRIDLDYYTITGTIVFTYFINLSVDSAIHKLNISNASVCDNLASKVFNVASYFRNNGYFCTPNKEVTLQDFASLDTILSIKENNLDLSVTRYPEAAALKKTWDDMEPLIMKIWELI